VNSATPEAQNLTNQPARGHAHPDVVITIEMHRSWNISRHVDVDGHMWIEVSPHRRTCYIIIIIIKRDAFVTCA